MRHPLFTSDILNYYSIICIFDLDLSPTKRLDMQAIPRKVFYRKQSDVSELYSLIRKIIFYKKYKKVIVRVLTCIIF